MIQRSVLLHCHAAKVTKAARHVRTGVQGVLLDPTSLMACKSIVLYPQQKRNFLVCISVSSIG